VFTVGDHTFIFLPASTLCLRRGSFVYPPPGKRDAHSFLTFASSPLKCQRHLRMPLHCLRVGFLQRFPPAHPGGLLFCTVQMDPFPPFFKASYASFFPPTKKIFHPGAFLLLVGALPNFKMYHGREYDFLFSFRTFPPHVASLACVFFQDAYCISGLHLLLTPQEPVGVRSSGHFFSFLSHGSFPTSPCTQYCVNPRCQASLLGPPPPLVYLFPPTDDYSFLSITF